MRVRGRKRYFAFKWIKRGLAIWGVILSLLGILWWRGTLPNWIQRVVTEGYIREIQPHLPFKIESLDIEQGLGTLISGFWSGKVTQVTAVLRWGGFRIRLAGPISVIRNQKKEITTVDYSPLATLEPAKASIEKGERSEPFRLDLQLTVSSSFTQLKKLSIQGSARDWDWKYYKIESKDPSFSAAWDGNSARISIQAKSAKFEKKENTGAIKEFQIRTEFPLDLSPFTLGPEATLSIRSNGAEILLGEMYLDIPAGLFPIETKISIFQKPKIFPRATEVRFGGGSNRLRAEVSEIENKIRRGRLEWKIPPTILQKFSTQLVSSVAQAGGPLGFLSELSKWDFGTGTLETHGQAEFSLTENLGSPALQGISFGLKTKDLKLKPHGKPLSLDGIDLELKGSSQSGVEGSLSVKKLRFRKLFGELKPVSIRLKPIRPFPSGEYSIDMNNGKELPLTLEDLNGWRPRVLGPKGKISIPLKGDKEFKFDVKSGLTSDTVSLPALGPKFCMRPSYVPPLSCQFDFRSIHLTEDSIDPSGEFRAELFGGKISLSDVGLFDLSTEAPETDLNFNLDGLRLDLLGQWLGFGDMDGIMNVHFRDVTFQSWLPTHYDFRLELKPFHKRDIVFSPTAMKNVIKIFARGDIDALPFYAQFLGFGPIRELLGGYDIDYGGISVFSSDGLIMIETHDPPEIVRKEKKHFVLYGSNFIGSKFTMPLDTKDYPFIVDATALNNYIAGRYRALKELAEEKALKTPRSEKENINAFDLSDPLCRE